MPDHNTIFLEKKGDGETVVIRYTEAQIPVKPIIASQYDILCSAFDNDFADKMMALKAGECCSHTFPIPIYFERLPGNAWKIRKVSEPA